MCFIPSLAVFITHVPSLSCCRKFAVQDGSRYFWEARFVTATFDASPQCLVEVDRMLRNEANVLRSFTMKMDTAHERVTTNMYKNPYFFEKAMPVPTK